MTGKIFRQIKSRFDPELYGWSSHIRWPLMSIAVGSVSGLGAIFFEELLRYTLHHFLQLPTGFIEPIGGMGAETVAVLASIRSWWFLVIPTLGGLVSGLLVYFIAPEAAGRRHRCHDRVLSSSGAGLSVSACLLSKFWLLP